MKKLAVVVWLVLFSGVVFADEIDTRLEAMARHGANGVVTYDTENCLKQGEFLKKNALEGKALAQVFWGWCYFAGNAVTQDDTKAVEWFSKSAEQGNAMGQYMLTRCSTFN